MHRKASRALKPPLLPGELVKLQEGESVACGAVAEPRSLVQGAGPPDQLSGAERQLSWDQIAEGAVSGAAPAELGYRLGAETAVAALILRAAMSNRPVDPDAMKAAERGAEAVFPVKASDLPELTGQALGDRLRELENLWVASDLRLTLEALLRQG